MANLTDAVETLARLKLHFETETMRLREVIAKTASVAKALRVVDDDIDEITVRLDGHEVRGWSYKNEGERRTKMLCAREFVEGWYQAADYLQKGAA